MGKFYTNVPFSHSGDAARLQRDSMGIDYGMDDGIDNNYLADRIKVQSPLNPGGVLIPAVIAASAYMAGKNSNKDSYSGIMDKESPLPKEKIPLVGPMSAGNAGYDANMPGTMMFQDNFVPVSGDNRVYYQETDTGLRDMMLDSLSDSNNIARADYGGALSNYFMNPIDNSSMYTNPVDESVFDFNKPTTIENVPRFIESNIVNPTKNIFLEYIESFKREIGCKK